MSGYVIKIPLENENSTIWHRQLRVAAYCRISTPSAANVTAFVEKAKRYTEITELTPEILRLFIQRIEVGERATKYARNSTQSIRIIYRDIGVVDSEMEQGEAQPHIAPPLSEAIRQMTA